jgi:hypothetical protein
LRATKSWFIVRTSFQQPLETSLERAFRRHRQTAAMPAHGRLARAFGKEDQLTTA